MEVMDDIGDPSFAARVTEEVRRAEASLPDSRRVPLAHAADGSFGVELIAPSSVGRHPVTVVVRDAAGNHHREVVWLDVR